MDWNDPIYDMMAEKDRHIAELERVLDAVRPVIAASVEAHDCGDPSDDYADVRALRLIDGLAARDPGVE